MLLANFQLIRENQISEILGRNKENYFQIGCDIFVFWLSITFSNTQNTLENM